MKKRLSVVLVFLLIVLVLLPTHMSANQTGVITVTTESEMLALMSNFMEDAAFHAEFEKFVEEIERYVHLTHGSITVTEYDNKLLTWRKIYGTFVLESVESNRGIANFEYDNAGNRTRKTVNGVITDFFYEESFLIRETTGLNIIEYVYEYDTHSGLKTLKGIIINGVSFSYYFDDKGRIIGLLDDTETLVVKYHYGCNLEIIATQVLVDGIFVDALSAPDSIGLQNNKVGTGQYLDCFTGWYFQFGRYFNPYSHTFVSKPIAVDFKEFESFRSGEEYANAGRNALMLISMANASSTFGRPLPHGPNWHYNENLTPGLAEFELLARLIFGEANSYIDQVRGVGWVVMTRAEHWNRNRYSGPTLSGVARRRGAFAVITGPSNDTVHARTPALNNLRWTQSVQMAAFMSASGNSRILRGALGNPPVGYSDQLYFLSRTWFNMISSNVTGFNFGTGVLNGNQPIRDIHNLGVHSGNVFFNHVN